MEDICAVFFKKLDYFYRKCCAISWEPFELLGQLIVPQTDYSLDLAASDSEIFVLGRSILPSTLSLLGAPYAVSRNNFQVHKAITKNPFL